MALARAIVLAVHVAVNVYVDVDVAVPLTTASGKWQMALRVFGSHRRQLRRKLARP